MCAAFAVRKKRTEEPKDSPEKAQVRCRKLFFPRTIHNYKYKVNWKISYDFIANRKFRVKLKGCKLNL